MLNLLLRDMHMPPGWLAVDLLIAKPLSSAIIWNLLSSCEMQTKSSFAICCTTLRKLVHFYIVFTYPLATNQLNVAVTVFYEAVTQGLQPAAQLWWAYINSHLFPGMVDVIFADVAQPDQTRIVALNAHNFLKNGGHFVISIKVH